MTNEYYVDFVALLFTMTSSFQHLYHNKDEEWAKKTLEGLNKILNCHAPVKKYGFKPGSQAGDDILSMRDLIDWSTHKGERWEAILADSNYIQTQDENILSAIYGTIETSFKHVYDNKEQEWAKQTLEGLRKVANYDKCYGENGVLPGTQAGCMDVTMDHLGFYHYDATTWFEMKYEEECQKLDEAEQQNLENMG